jgi:tRNA(Ile)-lysidine synthase
MGAADLEERVFTAIRRHGLMSSGDSVVVGVSGGPDSLALLHVLWRLSDRLGVRLHAAHLDHLLRGADAAEDARLVAQTCSDWGLTATLAIRDVPKAARSLGLGAEEAARRLRYEFLAQTALQIGARRVAVAHNADDQAETVLMHLLRGAGLAGLRGMRPYSGWPLPPPEPQLAPDWKGLVLVRPLLGIRRADIETHLEVHRLEPRRDPTNVEVTAFRNRLRHELLPYLERYNPRVRDILVRMADVLVDDYDFIHQTVEKEWSRVVDSVAETYVFRLPAWQELHPSLQRALLREAVGRLRPSLRDLAFEHVEGARRIASRGRTGSEAVLPSGLRLIRGYDSFVLGHESPKQDAPQLSDDGRKVNVPGRTEIGDGWLLEVETADCRAVSADIWTGVVDRDYTGDRLYVRRRQAGDRFRPLGMRDHSQSVRRFMIDHKLPTALRQRWPLVVNPQHIIWIPGHRLDDRARVTEVTRRCWRLSVRRE